MRYAIIPACLALLLSPGGAKAQFHPDARRAYDEHWRTHPEHHEDLVRLWHRHLFRRDIPAPLLARWSGELRRGIAAPVALAHVLASPEYYVEVGSRPEAFIRRSFTEIVGRPPTEPEFHFWLERLYHSDRNQVAYEMVTRYPPAWISGAPVPVEHYEYRPPVVRYRP